MLNGSGGEPVVEITIVISCPGHQVLWYNKSHAFNYQPPHTVSDENHGPSLNLRVFSLKVTSTDISQLTFVGQDFDQIFAMSRNITREGFVAAARSRIISKGIDTGLGQGVR